MLNGFEQSGWGWAEEGCVDVCCQLLFCLVFVKDGVQCVLKRVIVHMPHAIGGFVSVSSGYDNVVLGYCGLGAGEGGFIVWIVI